MSAAGQEERYAHEKYIVLETYRRNGEGVRTPVWFVVDNSTLFVRTAPRSGKMKRLRNNGRLKLAVSSGSGTAKGPWAEAKYAILAREEEPKVVSLMREKYGLSWKMVRVLHRLQGKPNYAYLSINPAKQ